MHGFHVLFELVDFDKCSGTRADTAAAQQEWKLVFLPLLYLLGRDRKK